MNTASLIIGGLILTVKNRQIEGSSGWGKEAKGIIVSALNCVLVDDTVSPFRAQAQRQRVARGVCVVDHRPFMEPKAIKMCRVACRAAQEVGDIANRTASALQKVGKVYGYTVFGGAVIAPLGVRRSAF